MRVRGWMTAILMGLLVRGTAMANPAEPPAQLVREVVYNELHDHQLHGYWRYWITQQTQQQTRVSEQVETADGPVVRLVASNGHPLSGEAERGEQERLEHLLSSSDEQARHRQDYAADEQRIGRILALLPDAFLYESEGEENGCYHLRFRPNPDYPPHGIEARIFHAMQGELWIDIRYKRLARLDGTLQENVDFGYGLLGRLYKGGWFRLERTQVSPTDWKTARLEMHMNGRALLFKTISRETSETRAGFTPVPARLTLEQGVSMLGVKVAQSAHVAAPAAPSFPARAMAFGAQR
ncbi:MAG TPA: hypothetical protein VG893_08195 [Terracidiphilus sp.]|nr:hypothetical protein [Terracidiphilus sp.]